MKFPASLEAGNFSLNGDPYNCTQRKVAHCIVRNRTTVGNQMSDQDQKPPERQRPNLNPKTTLAMAIIAGGQPEVVEGSPGEAKAICHLEPPRQEKYAPQQPRKTLVIDIENGRFHCRKCRQQGGVAEMLAITWKTSIDDAITLAPKNLKELTVTRPTPDDSNLPPATQVPDAPTVRQYTPVLNDAYSYYRRNLNRDEPYKYLYQLGINTTRAAAAGIGFGTRTTDTPLLKHLKEHHLNTAEIESSRLTVGPNKQHDRFEGKLTLAEKNHSGAVIWYASTSATSPNDDQQWSETPPPVSGLPGSRPFMIGVTNTKRHPQTLVVTDDIRYFIAVRCYQNETPVWMNDRRTSEDAPRFAELVARTNPDNIVMAFHDIETRDALIEATRQNGDAPKGRNITQTALMRFVDSRRYGRDWSFLGTEAMGKIQRGMRTDRRRESMGHPTKYTPTPRRGDPPKGPTQIKILDRPPRQTKIERAMQRLEDTTDV